MWRRTHGRTDVRTKSGKPHVGRPLLGPAKIETIHIVFKFGNNESVELARYILGWVCGLFYKTDDGIVKSSQHAVCGRFDPRPCGWRGDVELEKGTRAEGGSEDAS